MSALPAEPRAAWQRFTLLDMLLLQAGFGIGCSVALLPAADVATPSSLPYLAQRGLLAVLLGAVVAGPIVLVSQRMFRGRRAPLSAGEWLWLSPLAVAVLAGACALVAVALFWGKTDPVGEEVLGVVVLGGIFLTSIVIFLETILAMAGLMVLLTGLLGDRTVPCFWTDQFGGATCFLLWVGLLLIHGSLG